MLPTNSFRGGIMGRKRLTEKEILLLPPHRQKTILRERKYKETHRIESQQYSKKYKLEHPTYHNKYYKLNKESYACRDKKWRKENPGRSRIIRKRYEARHPEARQLKESKRRALELNAPGICSAEQWKARVRYYGNKCFYCKLQLTWKKNNINTTTQEHRIPLSRHGSNWPSNLVPACLKCNLKKNRKTPAEFNLMA